MFTFGTLEDFWRMHSNTYSVKQVIPNTDYLLFRKGIKPEWEDEANKQGGKWVVTLPIEDDMDDECEYAWTYLVMAVVGGVFDANTRYLINGIVFSIRDKH